MLSQSTLSKGLSARNPQDDTPQLENLTDFLIYTMGFLCYRLVFSRQDVRHLFLSTGGKKGNIIIQPPAKHISVFVCLDQPADEEDHMLIAYTQ